MRLDLDFLSNVPGALALGAVEIFIVGGLVYFIKGDWDAIADEITDPLVIICREDGSILETRHLYIKDGSVCLPDNATFLSEGDYQRRLLLG